MDSVFVSDLLDRYPALLFDAYGVLVTQAGPLPGACELIARLNHSGQPYCLISNAASHPPHLLAERFQAWGLAIAAERIITSGSLLHAQLSSQAGVRCLVLGGAAACDYVREAGATVVDDEVEAIIVADEEGFPLLERMNLALTQAFLRLDAQLPLQLWLCNPDLIYPTGPGRFGFTSGALALWLEAALQERYGEAAPTFVRLGKPYAPIYQAAVARVGTRAVLMVGDQPRTDILGAQRFGIDSALMSGGVAQVDSRIQATYVVQGLLR